MNEEYTKVVLALIRYQSENNKEEYEKRIKELAELFEKDNKIELAEYVLAQIGIGAWTVE